MADIEIKKKSKEIGSGILMPALKHQFKNRYYWTSTIFEVEKCGEVLSLQTIATKFDLSKKTIHISIEQPISRPEMIEVLIDFTRTSMNKLEIDLLDGSAKAISTVIFDRLKCISHEMELDYAKSETVTHELKFIFSSART